MLVFTMFRTMEKSVFVFLLAVFVAFCSCQFRPKNAVQKDDVYKIIIIYSSNIRKSLRNLVSTIDIFVEKKL